MSDMTESVRSQSATGAVRIPITVFGASLSLFFAITYVLCVLYGLIVTDQGMHQLMPLVLPGFTWLDWQSFLLGLVEVFVYGWYVALVFGWLFNFLTARMR